MRYQKFLLVILIFTITFHLVALPPNSFGNPVVITDSSIGGIFANSTHVQLPQADVNIHIKYLGAFIFDVNVSCRFTIYSNITQTSTLAFAYPSSWTEHIIYNTTEFFNITFDGELVEKWDFKWRNATWIPEVDEVWYIVGGAPAFVGFNVEIESYVSHTLEVETAFRKVAIEESFGISYVYGSAQTFEGYVRENITMNVEESVPLREVEFWPDNNLTCYYDDQLSIGTWNLIFDETDGYAVYTLIKFYEHETYTSYTVSSLEVLFVVASISSVFVIAAITLRKFRI